MAQAASNAMGWFTKISGFERLLVTGASGQSLNLTALGGFSHVTTDGALGLTNMPNGGTLVITQGGVGTYGLFNPAFTAGTSDVVNITLSNAGAITFGSLFTPDIETVALTLIDTQAVPTGVNFGMNFTAPTATLKTLTFSGNAGFGFGGGPTSLTTVDASGITLGGFTWFTPMLTDPVAVKGAANGANQLNAAQALSTVSYFGGGGQDIVTLSNNGTGTVAMTTAALTAGATGVFGGAGSDQITGGTGADFIMGGADTDVINAGDGPGANVIVGGRALDFITLGTGAVDRLVYLATQAEMMADGNTTPDNVTGFNTAQDKLVFSALAGNYNLGNNDGAVNFVVANGIVDPGVAGAEVILVRGTTFGAPDISVIGNSVTSGRGVIVVGLGAGGTNVEVWHDSNGRDPLGWTILANIGGQNQASVDAMTAASFEFIL